MPRPLCARPPTCIYTPAVLGTQRTTPLLGVGVQSAGLRKHFCCALWKMAEPQPLPVFAFSAHALRSVETPAVVLERRVLERNIARMAALAAQHKVSAAAAISTAHGCARSRPRSAALCHPHSHPLHPLTTCR